MSREALAPKHRRLRRALVGVGASLLLVFLLGCLGLLLQPVRERLLSYALARLASSLTGQLRVREARWPDLGRVDLAGVEWSEAGTMLFAAEKLSLVVALAPLRHGDVAIERLVLLGVRFDLPAVRRSLQSRPRPAERSAPARKRGFPREGSLPGVPSVGIEALELEAPWLRLCASEATDDAAGAGAGAVADDGARAVALRGQFDFRHGVVPRLQVESVRVDGPPGSWRVDSLALDLDLASGTASGHGRGSIGPDWPLQLDIDADGTDRFVLRLAEGERDGPPHRMGLVARARVERRGLAVDSLAFTATLRTPGTSELSRVPALAARLHGKPSFAGVQFEGSGALVFSPRPALRLGLACLPGDLISAGSLHFEGGGGAWEVRCDSLQAADLHLRGRLRADLDSLTVAARLDLLGRGWRDWLRSSRIPELSLRSQVDFRQRRGEAAARLRLSSSGSIGGHGVDHLLLDGRLGLRPETVSSFQLRVASHAAAVGLAVEIRRGDTLQARLSPIVVEAARGAVANLEPRAAEAATLVFAPKSRSLALDGLQVRGAAGNLDLDAHFDSSAAGSLQARFAWPRFPVLLARLARLDGSQVDTLQAHWGEEGPYRLQWMAEAREGTTTSSGDFSLPGPRLLAAVWPALRYSDPGALAGTFHLRTAAGGRFEAEIDGGESAWLDSLHLRLAGSRESLQVREARLQWQDLRLAVDGGMEGEALALQARWNLVGSSLLRRFVQLSPSDSIQQLELDGRARLSGPRRAPALTAEVEGSFTGLGFKVPAIRALVQRDAAGILGRLTLASGAESRWIALDRLEASVSSPEPGRWLPERAALHARGPGFELRQAARLGSEKPWKVDVDTLAVVLAGKDLVAPHPFAFSLADGRLQIDALELVGTLGRLRAHGVAGADSTRFTASMHLALPEEPPALSIPPTYWPSRVQFDLEASALDSLAVRGEIHGFKLAGSGEPTLRFRLDSAAQRLRASAALGDSTTSSLEGHATMPAQLQLYPPKAALLSGVVDGDLRFARLPFGVHTSPKRGVFGPEDLGRLGGRIVLGGTTAAIAAFAAIECGFPQSATLSSYVLSLRARAGEDAVVDSLWKAAPTALTVAAQAADDFLAGFALRSGNQVLLRGSAAVPLLFSLQRPFARATPSRSLMVRVNSEPLPLAALNPFLPRNAALEGVATLVLAVDGEVENPRLDGTLRTSEVELTLGDGSRLVFITNAELGGERRHPELRGDIEVKSGLVKVPEAERHLHPKAGAALLLGAVADTLQPPPAPESPEQTASALQRQLAPTALDLRIRVPKAFFVRGRGLDIEGAGEIQVTQKEGEPIVVGQLRGVRGTYSIAGRTLNLDRGTVTFPGTASPNPALDIQLSTNISGVKIRVLVTGTGEKPELVLSSDPEMQQTDIIALLALGKTYDQLSDEESNVMRERATAILVSMGATALQENVTKEFGIDVVQYKTSTGAPGATSEEQSKAGSLAFGKYLSPKVLLSYSYSLDRAVDDVVSLEYFLKGQLTLETLYSVKGQSGLGFGWAMEY